MTAGLIVFSASETTSEGFVGIFNSSSLGIVGDLTGSMFAVTDIGTVVWLKGLSAVGRKATDVVRGEARVSCGEDFAKVFAVSASGIIDCPCIEAVFADVATSGADFVVVQAFGAALDVVVSSRVFCFDVVDDLGGLLVCVVAETALGENLLGVFKPGDGLCCEMAFVRCEVCFCLFFPLSDEVGGNPGG